MNITWVIDLLAPFLSGIVGIAVAYGSMRQSIMDDRRRIAAIEEAIKQQVGDSRCYRMREECREAIKDSLDEIKREIVANRNWVSARFEEVARFMGRFNGTHQHL